MEHKAARKLFGNRVSSIRRAKGLTQEQLAGLVGKTVEHISFIERGERSPSFELILDLANTLDVSMPDLMNFEDFEEVEDSDTPEDVLSSFATPVPIEQVEEVKEPVASEDKRRSDLERLQDGFESLESLQQLAQEYGILDIFQDNGGKVLQLLILLGLRQIPGRTGNDAVDGQGREYELKTINIRNSKGVLKTSFNLTTNHHLNLELLNKYRQVEAWYVGIYEGVKLIKIYKVQPSLLESKFSEWQQKIQHKNI
ncbi:MAG TPA: type II site-specific deoxyribonuclease [Cyanobacteria bacterium UBA11371]|nr:type II site-specific deoxyribonuclease [Cyanobacteria bacterium UBA11371]